MWLPDWLYKALPFVYAVSGMIAVYSGGNFVGYGSGLLLVLTGLMVFKLRAGHATNRQKHRRFDRVRL